MSLPIPAPATDQSDDLRAPAKKRKPLVRTRSTCSPAISGPTSAKLALGRHELDPAWWDIRLMVRERVATVRLADSFRLEVTELDQRLITVPDLPNSLTREPAWRA